MSLITPYPDLSPTLTLDFSNAGRIDPRIAFTRASTATRVNAVGLIESVPTGAPQIDYNPATRACKGLRMANGNRTNYLLRSAEFDNATWYKSNLTITANTTETTAPDGTYTAEKVVESAISGAHYMEQLVTRDGSLVSTFSGYVKFAGRTDMSITLYDWTYSVNNNINFKFNSLTGAIQSAGAAWPGGNAAIYDAKVEDAGNGWWRFEISGIPTTSTGGTIDARLGFINSSSTYTGDGVSGVYLWGFQLENSYPATAYIPTTSATVTRAQEFLAITGVNFTPWYNPTEGTFVVTFTPLKNATLDAASYSVLNVSDNTNSNYIDMMNTGGSSVPVVRVYVSNVQQAYLSAPPYLNKGAENTVAFSYKLDAISRSTNGGAVDSDASALIPACTRLDIGGTRGGAVVFIGWIQRIAYYPKALPTSLQALST